MRVPMMSQPPATPTLPLPNRIAIQYGTAPIQGHTNAKESRDITVTDSMCRWKYPLWHSDNVTVSNTLSEFDAHAAFWYSNHMRFTDCTIQAPKEALSSTPRARISSSTARTVSSAARAYAQA